MNQIGSVGAMAGQYPETQGKTEFAGAGLTAGAGVISDAGEASYENLVAQLRRRADTWLSRWSWALWECATTPYIVLITVYIFAPYFTSTVVGDSVRGQALWGYINGFAGVGAALFAPVLGAIADIGGRRKPWIFAFTMLMVPALCTLWFAMPGAEGGLSIIWICIALGVTVMAYEFATMFHNAMLPNIVPQEKVGKLSGMGLAIGNIGGFVVLLLMLFCFALPGVVPLPFILDEPLWGFDHATHEPSRLVGPLVAIWAIAFTVPLMLFTPELQRSNMSMSHSVVAGLHSLRVTLMRLRFYKNVGLYLLARMLYNDGKTAIMVFAGVYAAGVFGWGMLDLLAYSIPLTMFAIFGGLTAGYVDERIGPKRATMTFVGMTTVALILAVSASRTSILWMSWEGIDQPVWSGPFLKTAPELFYMVCCWVLAMTITAAYSTSRSMLAQIAPLARMNEFFGLYALSGKATSFVGMFMVAWMTSLTGSMRWGFGSVVVLLIAGFVLMVFVQEKRSRIVQ